MILFYDGVCGLCDRLVQLILRHDRRRVFKFAALQGELARRTLAAAGHDADDLDTVWLLDENGRLVGKGRAILAALGALGFPWSLATVLGVLPTRALDWGYERVAERRYRLFGKLEQCRVPTAEERSRFVD